MATVTWDSGVTSKGQASEVSYTYNNSHFATQLNTIPPYAIINSVKITAKFQVNLYTNYGTLKIGGVEVANTGNTNNHDWVTIVNDLDITSYLTGKSGTENAGTLPDITVYASKRSGLIRTFKTQVTITWDYTVPTYTATFKNGDGSVLKTVSVTSGFTPSYVGLEPTKASDYEHAYSWSGAWSPPLGDIYSNTEYTPVFNAHPRQYEIRLRCVNDVTGELCNLSGGGLYYPGDKVTIEAIDIPANHKLSLWFEQSGRGIIYHYSNPLTFEITSELVDGGKHPIVFFDAYLEHTGYNVTVNISPNVGAGVVKHGVYVSDDLIIEDGTVDNETFVVSYETRDRVYIEAVPNSGYKFVCWSDGNTSNPRKVSVTSDITYIAVFEKELINTIQVGKTKPSGVYLNVSTKTITIVIADAVSITPSGADTLDGYHVAISNVVPSGVIPIKSVQVGTSYVYTT